MGGFSGYGIVDTKMTGFVFLLILSCWGVLLLGSPALHCVGPDRLQMVGVGSLHVDSPCIAVASYFRRGQQFYTVVTS